MTIKQNILPIILIKYNIVPGYYNILSRTQRLLCTQNKEIAMKTEWILPANILSSLLNIPEESLTRSFKSQTVPPSPPTATT